MYIINLTSVVCVFSVAQTCPTPCDPMDCSPPGSSVHGILQARRLERVAASFSRYVSVVDSKNIFLSSNCVSVRGFYFLPQDPQKTTKDVLMRSKIQIVSRGRCKTVLAIKR